MKLDIYKLVNVSLHQAENICRKHGMQMRVINKDGKSLLVTQDYEESRINVSVKNNIVVMVEGLG
jgi:outer membrane lipoprotein SlyB